jgi:hypothetical protein
VLRVLREEEIERRRFRLTPEAVEDGKRLGLSPVALQSIADASGKFTHRIAHRQIGKFLFEMGGNEVLRVFREEEIERRNVEIVCPECDAGGEPCEVCGGSGFVHEFVTFIAGEPADDVTLKEELDDGNQGGPA